AAERVVKLLETPWSGLPTGLAPASGEGAGADAGTNAGSTEAGLSYLGIAVQSLAAEARLLAAPVSFELASTSHAEGIEDRTTMAPLAARRLADMVGLGQRIVAVEMVVAAQAAELRGHSPHGRGTAAALAAVRKVVPSLEPGGEVPDVEPLVAVLQSDGIGRLPGRQ
ncbi:MAG: hypothetical protein E6I94_06635, partial [Chloroflexi bacterium]